MTGVTPKATKPADQLRCNRLRARSGKDVHLRWERLGSRQITAAQSSHFHCGDLVYPKKGPKVDTYAEEVVLLSVDIAVLAPERRGPFLPG